MHSIEASLKTADHILKILDSTSKTKLPKHGKRKPMKNNRGFSLLELLIVVAIILIIATIAIPSLLRSRQAANESAAVSNIRTINTAEVTYLSSAAGSYGTLTDLVSAGLVDNRFANASSNPVSGYLFSVQAAGQNYTAWATPASPNSGRYAYFALPDAVIKYQTSVGICGSPTGDCFPAGMSGAPVQ